MSFLEENAIDRKKLWAPIPISLNQCLLIFTTYDVRCKIKILWGQEFITDAVKLQPSDEFSARVVGSKNLRLNPGLNSAEVALVAGGC